MHMSRPLVMFVDIDDTLIRSFGSKRIAIGPMVERVRDLHREGAVLYAWSTAGGEYARASAAELGLLECFFAFLPKPNVMIDDQPFATWRETFVVDPHEAANLSVDDYRRRLAWVEPAPPRSSTTTLFRPVGPSELELIERSGSRRFPPRLPEQPIFYPVCNERYAREIAEKWNVAASGAGIVTRFEVSREYLARYERHVVGGSVHEEYWIPAEELDAFNDAIVGTIAVVARYP